MAYVAIPGAASQGSSAFALSRAQTLLGNTINTVLGTDFDNDQWFRLATFAGAPTAAVTTTERGGIVVGDSSATANSVGGIFPHGTTVIDIDNPQTSRWYFYARVAYGTAIDAQAVLQLLMSTAAGGNPVIRFGVVGSASTSFVAYQITNNGGATTASGTTTFAIDQNVYHDMEIYNDTTNLSLSIDGTVYATTASSNLGTSPCAFGLTFANGTTAASRTIKCDKLYVCCAQP